MKYCSLQSEEIAGMTLHMEAKQKHIQKQHQCVAMYKSILLLLILSRVNKSMILVEMRIMFTGTALYLISYFIH